MARLPIEKGRLGRLAGRSVAGYVDFVHRHSNVVVEPANLETFLEQHRPAIIAVWHGQFLLSPKVKPLATPLAVMLARHGDAELFSTALARFNTTLIRGAGAAGRRKDRGGAKALRAALGALDDNVFVGMTADVPPGPARKVGKGIVTLARLSGRPIIPLAAATSRYVALRTWSRMTVNLPFGSLAGVFGEPIFVDENADDAALEVARLAVEDGLNRATARAYALAGADPRRATPPVPRGDAPTHHAGDDERRTLAANAESERRRRLGLAVYALTTRLLQPVAPFVLRSRERRGKEDRSRRPERYGMASRSRPDGTLVWFHAASVGELGAVLPLSKALREARPDLHYLFTTGTVTSAEIAARRLAPCDVHQYLPLDAPRYVRRFLDHWRPDLAILTESEIWPNLLWESSARGIPLALVNARMSDRSYDRWLRMRGLTAPLFSLFDVVLAQNASLARKFSDVGARKTVAVGNLKIDSPPLQLDEAELRRLRDSLQGRIVLVAASTHEGEERIIAAAHKRLSRDRPELCTVIAPRHPERGLQIAEELESFGLKVEQRSRLLLPTQNTDVYIADTIGELGTIYALGQIAIIGGSLVERGGQNPIEAIRAGAVVITGPNWQNFKDAYDMLIFHKAAVVVANSDELATAVSRLLDDEVELQRMRAGAAQALSVLSGALDKTVAELLPFLPKSGGPDEKGLRCAG